MFYVLSATTSQKLSMCVLRNMLPQVFKCVFSAPSSYTLSICSKHRIAGYIVLWQCLYLYVSTQYDARLVRIALVSDVWNASESTYIAVYMSASLPTDTSTYLTATLSLILLRTLLPTSTTPSIGLHNYHMSLGRSARMLNAYLLSIPTSEYRVCGVSSQKLLKWNLS